MSDEQPRYLAEPRILAHRDHRSRHDGAQYGFKTAARRETRARLIRLQPGPPTRSGAGTHAQHAPDGSDHPRSRRGFRQTHADVQGHPPAPSLPRGRCRSCTIPCWIAHQRQMQGARPGRRRHSTALLRRQVGRRVQQHALARAACQGYIAGNAAATSSPRLSNAARGVVVGHQLAEAWISSSPGCF